MADCLLFYRSRSDLSKFEKSINMWNFYQPAGWFIEKSDGIFCHPCSCSTAAMLGYSELGKNLQVPSTVRVMESISPYGCMLQVFLLLFCYSLTLGFVILVGNLYKGKTKGMVFGLLYSVFGFLLEPSVVAAILHKEKYEMYQVNVLICWISPLNQAVYGKHNFGYDPLLPTIWQSCMFFAGILFVLMVLALRRMKKYPFEFLGEKT